MLIFICWGIVILFEINRLRLGSFSAIGGSFMLFRVGVIITTRLGCRLGAFWIVFGGIMR